MSAVVALIRDVRIRLTKAKDPMLCVDLSLPDGGVRVDKITLFDTATPKLRKRSNASMRRLKSL